MAFTIILSIWIYITPWFRNSDDSYPLYYFIFYALVNSVYALVFAAMALVKTAFFTHISDPQIGGTYMTLLNTVANIGVQWPATLVLYLIDVLSSKGCVYTESDIILNLSRKKKFLDIIKKLEENTCYSEYEVLVIKIFYLYSRFFCSITFLNC